MDTSGSRAVTERYENPTDVRGAFRWEIPSGIRLFNGIISKVGLNEDTVPGQITLFSAYKEDFKYVSR